MRCLCASPSFRLRTRMETIARAPRASTVRVAPGQGSGSAFEGSRTEAFDANFCLAKRVTAAQLASAPPSRQEAGRGIEGEAPACTRNAAAAEMACTVFVPGRCGRSSCLDSALLDSLSMGLRCSSAWNLARWGRSHCACSLFVPGGSNVDGVTKLPVASWQAGPRMSLREPRAPALQRAGAGRLRKAFASPRFPVKSGDSGHAGRIWRWMSGQAEARDVCKIEAGGIAPAWMRRRCRLFPTPPPTGGSAGLTAGRDSGGGVAGQACAPSDPCDRGGLGAMSGC